MLVKKKIQLKKKVRLNNQFISGSEHVTNTKRLQSVEKKSQQHSQLSSNRNDIK